MACIENMPSAHVDSEREEGEIVDELDELSDISSEEEYLLRQRLQVLENYNHVLERKEAKRCTSIGPGHEKIRGANSLKSADLSDISITNFEDNISVPKQDVKQTKSVHHKHRRKKEILHEHSLPKYKDHKKKQYRPKRKLEPKVISESSEESDYEYRNKRRKLANAVLVKKNKTDVSLKARLMKMMCHTQSLVDQVVAEPEEVKNLTGIYAQSTERSDIKSNDVPGPEELIPVSEELIENKVPLETKEDCPVVESELIDLSSDEGSVQIVSNNEEIQNTPADVVDGVLNGDTNNQGKTETGSDDDLELLRQHALKSKASKTQETCKETPTNLKPPIHSEDEDSDTAELRLICLRSALLKKAIEMKQKQKLRKRLSQSSTLFDDIMANEMPDVAQKNDDDNNTDIESMDMDIGSDGQDHEDKGIICNNSNKDHANNDGDIVSGKNIPQPNIPKDDDLDEDEDLLRAKLLTSLSKSLPLLVETKSSESNENNVQNNKKSESVAAKTVEENTALDAENRFIINTGCSDSEGEHEATKNLTKMHMKLSTLSEQVEFQQKLDMFLKSARMEVEKTKLPDVVQQQSILPLPKTPQKFVPKTVNHLPKSEQIEYKNLVKRMAELEKIKKARQLAMNSWNNELITLPIAKDTLKPRNVTIEIAKPMQKSDLDEQIALSRKKIAEESAKVLQLKEEQNKLSQKYKIVATELRNISTAITLNKKQQKTAQIQLSKIRAQHQLLLKRSTTTIHAKHTTQLQTSNRSYNKTLPSKLQKENEPIKSDYLDPSAFRNLKVSVVNDYKEKPAPAELPEKRLSVQINVTNNTKTVTIPNKNANDPDNDRGSERVKEERAVSGVNNHIIVKEGSYHGRTQEEHISNNADDYKSPLQAFTDGGWTKDPNGVLCPFEVGGSCKDANCKYLHARTLTH